VKGRAGSSSGLAVVRYPTKKEYVTHVLREEIISGARRPGDRVMQQEVADALGMSVTPVREAIRQLESEGYLESVAHVGVRVPWVDFDGLDEVYRLRRQLEGDLAAEAARRVTADGLATVRRLLESFAAAVEARDRIAARRANYRFHLAIFELAAQPVTLGLVNSLWAKFPWDSLDDVEGRGRRALAEHGAQLAALETGDPEASRRAEQDHIARSRRYVIEGRATVPSAGTEAGG
jgi:DNA-binding GntR family transcriptional regulator